jgi:diketogulonate reductase-like aldo/keto reductase
MHPMQRRDCLRTLAAAAALPAWAGATGQDSDSALLHGQIPRTGERVPAVGMGTWLTFNVSPGDTPALQQRRQVLQRFFAGGGRVIDSSPMYGSAEEALGLLLPQVLPKVPGQEGLFSATKVWTPLTVYGRTQMQRSLALWGLPRVDLMQGHNLLNWDGHLPTLRALQAEGRIRHLGVTTSHGNKHAAMRQVLEAVNDRHPLQVLQITYNPVDRRAEHLMQMAADLGLGVIVNRPFDGGALLQRLAREPLPGLARELDCSTWAALVLKWELAFAPVTCVIPATTRADHVTQNLAAMHGPLPDARQRAALTALFERLLA